MIAIVFGTTGELIKLAPIIKGLEARGATPLLITTGQQCTQIEGFARELDLPQPAFWLARGFKGKDLERRPQIPIWGTNVLRGFLQARSRLRDELLQGNSRPLVLVHGDTMTTVVGCLVGKTLHATVAHVEAGMRSHDWRNPFPEEINRRLAARLTDLHFAPGQKAVDNLKAEKVRGRIIDTKWNTICDSLQLTSQTNTTETSNEGPFGLVSIHRHELIDNQDEFRQVLQALASYTEDQTLLFIDHAVTRAAIKRWGYDHLFGKNFRRIPRLDYIRFIQLLKRSSFLVTDSGGCQEECAFLGMPCLVHRAVTEHDTGLGGSVLLSRLKIERLVEFLENPEIYRVPPIQSTESPTKIILDTLQSHQFLSPSETSGHAVPV